VTCLINVFTSDDKVVIFALRIDKGGAHENDERISWNKLKAMLSEQINF